MTTHEIAHLGRQMAVIIARGCVRRVRFYTWFAVAEDENDTLKEVMDYQQVSRNIS